jgi:hypothetical protein
MLRTATAPPKAPVLCSAIRQLPEVVQVRRMKLVLSSMACAGRVLVAAPVRVTFCAEMPALATWATWMVQPDAGTVTVVLHCVLSRQVER